MVGPWVRIREGLEAHGVAVKVYSKAAVSSSAGGGPRGRHGRRQAGPRDARRRGRRARRRRQHRRRRRGPRRPTSRRTPTCACSGSPIASTRAAGASATRSRRWRATRAGDDVWFELGDEDLEIGRDRARSCVGERLTATLDALRGAGRRGARAADVRRAGAHLGRHLVAALPGVDDPRRRQGGRGRRVECAAPRRAAAPEVRGDRGGAAM